MKRIGIITITRGENYGNKLQNYAVQEVLKKLGFETHTILNSTKKGFNSPISFFVKLKKLNPLYVLKVFKVRLKNKLFVKNSSDNILKSFFWEKKFRNEIRNIQDERVNAFSIFFKNYISQSNFTISITDLKLKELNKYDYFVCGSDQIWNPNYPQNSMIDFLQFATKSKRVAYAPSFGVNSIPNSKKKIYKKWLSEIPNLSVREDQGAEIIKELTGREVGVLVDPTLMLNKQEWLEIEEKPDLDIGKKYILTYFLGNQIKRYKSFIQKVAKEYSCNIINLNDIHEMESYKVDPSEFLFLINNAFLVCTDSFHGMVFSIIFNKEFIAFDRVEEGHSMSSRIETLLNKFDLMNRHFKNIKNFDTISEINFRLVEDIIKIEQDKTYNFFYKVFDLKIK